MTNLAPDAYRVTFACAPAYYIGQDRPVNYPGNPVVVTSAQTTTGVREALAKGGGIAGTVTDSAGHPLSDKCVTASNATDTEYATAFNGTYSVEPIPVGSYTVKFFDCGGSTTYGAVWYDGQTSAATANLVSVSAGATTQPINGVLPLASATDSRLSGHVRNVAGAVLTGICVIANGSSTSETVTASDGSWLLTGLYAGSYTLEFSDCNGGGYATQYLLTPVPVSAGTIRTNLDATLGKAGAIAGTITDTAGAPLAGICATATGAGGPLQKALSDSSGSYVLAGLTEGSFSVAFDDCSLGSFVPQYFAYQSVPTLATAGTPVPVRSGSTTSGVNARLSPGGAITGRVTDTNGNPLSGICLSIETGYNTYSLDPWLGGASPKTRADGTYRLGSLPAGGYHVDFTDCSYGTYGAQWYPASSSFSGAKTVTVAAGAGSPNIDARLVVGGSITGTVIDSSARPLARMCVNALPSRGGMSGFDITSTTGTYAISGLTPDAYTVQFYPCDGADLAPQWYNGQSTPETATTLAVASGATVTNIGATMQPGGNITGKVTDSSGSPITSACVYAIGSTSGNASTASDGTYRVTALSSGQYSVDFSDCLSGNFLPKTVPPVNVTAGQTTTSVNASLSPAGKISGLVTDAAGSPVVNAGVSASGGSGSGNSGTDSLGSYAITALAPGSYTVMFQGCAGCYLTQYYNAKATAAAANPVAVTAGRTTTGINATMQPPPPPRPPGPPGGVTALASNGQVTVSWTPPSSQGSGPVSFYAVTTIAPPGATAPGPLIVVDTTATLSGLTNGAGYVFQVSAYNSAGTGPAAASATVYPQITAGGFVSLVPFRILDTRAGTGAPRGQLAGGHILSFPVLGIGGVPASGTAAVLVNLTVTGTSASGYLTAWPAGATQPNASNLNWGATQSRANLAVLPVGAGGSVSVFNSAGSIDVVADVVGYFTDGSTVAQARLSPLTPSRILDTRSGTGAPRAPVGAGQSLPVSVVGVGGVPAGASAVVMNLTVTNTTTNGYLTAWPAGTAQPNASTLNWGPGETVPNLAVLPVGAEGQIELFSSAGTSDLIADVVGYFGVPGAPTGERFTPLVPSRILDTRAGIGTPGGPLGPRTTLGCAAVAAGGVPSSGVGAVVMNLTATDTTSASYLTAWPNGTAQPNASTLNWTAGQTVPNLALVAPGVGGKVNLFNDAGQADLIADAAGWFNDGTS